MKWSVGSYLTVVTNSFQSFISCSQGIWMVGLVTIPYGIVNAIVSFTSGGIAKYIGRLPIFIAGQCVIV